MKTIYFLFTCALVSLNVNTVHAQDIQKKYGNEIYNIYGWTTASKSEADMSISIANSRNTFGNGKSEDWCNCNIGGEGLAILTKVMKSVFTQDKQKALASKTTLKKITYLLYYDAATGQILNVRFRLVGVSLSENEESSSAVTLKEIYQLETRLKAEHFTTNNCDCSKNKYGYGMCTMLLNRLGELKE